MTTVQERLRALELERDQIAQKLDSSMRGLEAANIEVQRLRHCELAMAMAESELVLIKRSLSWRLTRPLRVIRPAIQDVRAITRRVTRLVFACLARFMLRVPGARPLARRMLGRHPWFKQRLVNLIRSPRVPVPPDDFPGAGEGKGLDHQSHLSRSASEALDLLKQYRDSEHASRQRRAS